MTQNDVQRVVDAARQLLGEDQSKWVEPLGYPNSLAHCIIDSTYSLRARYSSVINVRIRYDDVRKVDGGDPTTDGVHQLIRAIDDAGGAEDAALKLFGNRAMAPGTNRLKSVVIYEAALALDEAGVRTTEDLRGTANGDGPQAEVKKAWLGVSGLGQASWRYLLMLAGVDGTKPDVMIRRFVTSAVGAEKMVSPDRAGAAIEGAAVELKVKTFLLDHTVWRYQSGRWAGPEDIFVDQ